MENNTPLKSIPIAIEKTRLVNLYRPMGEKFLREEINRIIIANRRNKKPFDNLSDDQIKRTHLVMRAEVIEFAKLYGLPDGYCLPLNYNDEAK